MPNIIAPNTKEKALTLQEKIFQFNYEKSVAFLKPKIQKWQNLTSEILRALYIAREFLNGQKGQRKDPDSPNYIAYTWNTFCNDIGIARSTANRMLTLFLPAELSDNGSDRLLSPEEYRELKGIGDGETYNEHRVIKAIKTGECGQGWTCADAKEYALRMASKRSSELAFVWGNNERKKVKPARDYFSDILNHIDDLKKFRLESDEQNALQLQVFDTVDKYLQSFTDIKTRLQAAYNLSAKLHDAVNYYTELDVQANTKTKHKENAL